MLILSGSPLDDTTEPALALTVVGDRVAHFPIGPGAASEPVWVSVDGQHVVTADGAGRSNQGEWSSITSNDTVLAEPEQGVLWSVSHQRRKLTRFDLGESPQFEDYDLPADVERVLGRLAGGFLVVRDLGSVGSEFAVWTDDGSIFGIEGLAGREILDVGSSTLLLRASNRELVVMEFSPAGPSTLEASISTDFEVHSACLSPDETYVAVLGTDIGAKKFAVFELGSGLELLSEPLVDDFAWTTDEALVLTRGSSLLVSYLASAPRHIAELSPSYAWRVASSSSAC